MKGNKPLEKNCNPLEFSAHPLKALDKLLEALESPLTSRWILPVQRKTVSVGFRVKGHISLSNVELPLGGYRFFFWNHTVTLSFKFNITHHPVLLWGLKVLKDIHNPNQM